MRRTKMKATLYKVSDDRRVLNKVLGTGMEVNFNIKEAKDIDNPTIRLDYNSVYLQRNYVWIDEFDSYYHINSYQVKPGQEIILVLEVDPLMTIKDDIKASVGHVVRSTQGNKYLPDSMAQKTNRTHVQARRIGSIDNRASNDDFYVFIKGGK